MKVSILRQTYCCLLASLAFTSICAQEEDGRDPDTGRLVGSVGIGANSWSDLTDLETPQGQSFRSVGGNLEIAAYMVVDDWRGADVILGLEFGFFTRESDVEGRLEDLTQRGGYFLPTLKLRFGDRGETYWFLEGGAGWYKNDFAELDCDVTPCAELDDPFDENTFGGYLGVGVGFGRHLTVNLRAHQADFGRVTGVEGVSGTLAGPVYTLNANLIFAWPRPEQGMRRAP